MTAMLIPPAPARDAAKSGHVTFEGGGVAGASGHLVVRWPISRPNTSIGDLHLMASRDLLVHLEQLGLTCSEVPKFRIDHISRDLVVRVLVREWENDGGQRRDVEELGQCPNCFARVQSVEPIDGEV